MLQVTGNSLALKSNYSIAHSNTLRIRSNNSADLLISAIAAIDACFLSGHPSLKATLAGVCSVLAFMVGVAKIFGK